MKNNGAKSAGYTGPLRSPMAGSLVNKGTMRPPTGAYTTIPGSAPKSAPIRSPLQGQTLLNIKSK
jgi:hypothetical protein